MQRQHTKGMNIRTFFKKYRSFYELFHKMGLTWKDFFAILIL